MKRKDSQPVTPAQLEAEYRLCLARERSREWQWRHTRQGAFESSFVSYDGLLADGQSDKCAAFRTAKPLGTVVADGTSDGCLPLTRERKLKLDHACQQLVRAGKGHLVRVLRLIARNGNNRQESIWQLMMDNMGMNGQKDDTCATGVNSRSSTRSRTKRHPIRPWRHLRTDAETPENGV